MRTPRILTILVLSLAVALPATAAPGPPAAVTSLRIGELAGSGQWPPPLRRRIGYALSLTAKKLAYRYGKSSPSDGGMDCSGTMWHVLRESGIEGVPRTSAQIFEWVRGSGRLTRVTGSPELSDAVFASMRPGDLLFWTGTWNNGKPGAISHVMMYLGRTADGKPVMFGASDGRRYEGQRRSGVSVFDFRMPRPGSSARFAGFGPVPGTSVAGIAPVPPAGRPDKPKGPTQDNRSRKSR